MESGSLLEDVRVLLSSVPGAPERERVLSLLSEAKSIHVSDMAAKAISDTLASRAWTIEQNLDFLSVPFETVWIEWGEAARGTDIELLRDGVLQPDRVGVLIARHEEANTFIGTVAWRLSDGKVDVASAFFSFNASHLAEHSQSARRLYSEVARESWARVLSLIYTHVTAGLVAEMEELDGIRDRGPALKDLEDAARREVSAECLFVFGVLMLLSSLSAELTSDESGSFTLSMKPRGFLDWLRSPGFSRKSNFSSSYLYFKAP